MKTKKKKKIEIRFNGKIKRKISRSERRGERRRRRGGESRVKRRRW